MYKYGNLYIHIRISIIDIYVSDLKAAIPSRRLDEVLKDTVENHKYLHVKVCGNILLLFYKLQDGDCSRNNELFSRQKGSEG